MKQKLKRFGKVLLWTLIAGTLIVTSAIVLRVPYVLETQKTEKAVAKIHATKLTLADVAGENLPPEPEAELKDATVRGIDANDNGIRDDVELAIFAEYPDSAKTRAALLQYALALQMQFTQEIVNTKTVTATIQQESRANHCVADTLVPRANPESGRSYEDIEKIATFVGFVESRQTNTQKREEYREDFYENLGSYTLLSGCDINLTELPN